MGIGKVNQISRNIERDEANDKRAFALAERSNEAMNKLAASVDLNTKPVV